MNLKIKSLTSTQKSDFMFLIVCSLTGYISGGGGTGLKLGFVVPLTSQTDYRVQLSFP